MNILEMLMGNKEYPKFESAVYTDGSKTIVTVSRTLPPDWVELDTPVYIENKFKKRIPILHLSTLQQTQRQMNRLSM